MAIRTFQEDRIPEPVSKTQVNADRCIHIGKFPFDGSSDLYLLAIDPGSRYCFGLCLHIYSLFCLLK
jgi:hypothetical protein